MNIEIVKLMLENGKKDLKDVSDVQVELSGENRLFVSAKSTRIRKIILTFDVDIPEHAKILGDAFERAYGTLAWKNPGEDCCLPWYFLAKTEERIYGYGVKTQPNALCYWKIENGRLCFTADIGSGGDGLVFDGRSLEVCQFVVKEYEGDTFDAACEFCKELCDEPLLPSKPVYGGNDWYCNYGDNSFESIMSHARKIAECSQGLTNRPYMVVDDGWEIAFHNSDKDEEAFNGGPWQYPNRKFSDMKKLADEINKLDLIPGIWFRPLYTVEHFPQEIVMKKEGIKSVLDPSLPETLDVVKRDIQIFRDWGYRLIKHDFSTFDIFGKWGNHWDENFTDGVVFYDKKRTTAQIIKDMYAAIREASGKDVIIIGCNTVSHLSAGYFELMRTGDDTSGHDFAITKRMGINALAFRMPQHGSFYSADADCVGITPKIEWSKNKEWLDILSKSGTPLFVSISDVAYNEEIKKDISNAFRRASENTETARPLGWESSITPNEWETPYGKVKYRY